MLSKTLAMAAAFVACTAFVSDDGLKRERYGDESDAAKDAMEGKAPPKLEMDLWMNLPLELLATQTVSVDGGTQPASPTWKSFKGKVVVLDFWAYW